MSEQNSNFHPLELAKLDELDPRIEVVFQKLQAEMAEDCINRPGEPGKRTLIFQLDMVPVVEQDGVCEEVKLTASLRSKKPIFKSKEYSAMPTKAGFKFRTGGDNVRQTRLPLE